MANVRVYGGGGAKAGASREGSPLLAGVLVGIVLMVAWIVVARMTGNDVGLASWGVGGLIGIVIGKTAKPATRQTGVLAALLTAGTLLVSKIAVVMFALQPALRDELIQDPDATALVFLYDMMKNRSFSPELQHTIDTRPDLLRDSAIVGQGEELRTALEEELRFRMMSEAEARAKAATRADRERLVRAHYDESFAEQLGFWVLLLTSFGPLDLLWMGLGISTAWKLGQGAI